MTEFAAMPYVSSPYLRDAEVTPHEQLPYPDNIMPRPQLPPEATPNHQRPSWLRRKAVRLIGAACALGIGVAGVAIAHESDAPVEAQSPSSVALQVYRTDGDGLMLHPDSATIHSVTTDRMPDGSEFDVQCWKKGQAVFNNPIWEYGVNKSTGHAGYASDYYINIHWKKTDDLVAQGIPECGTALPPKATSTPAQALQPAAEVQPFTSYDRNAAKNWALAHATDKPPDAGSCTWFVSQAMGKGGFPQDGTWNLNFVGVTRDPKLRYGSDAARKTPDFLNYMKTLPYVHVQQVASMAVNNLPEVRTGDVILYDWENDGNVDHADLVTGASQKNAQYPLVSGWSEKGSDAVNYKQRGWTYSEIHKTFLQDETDDGGKTHPNKDMVAYYVHIRTQEDLGLR